MGLWSRVSISIGPVKMEIIELTREFGRAAVRVRRAGFDAVAVHGAHGYLVSQFFSPLLNQRQR